MESVKRQRLRDENGKCVPAAKVIAEQSEKIEKLKSLASDVQESCDFWRDRSKNLEYQLCELKENSVSGWWLFALILSCIACGVIAGACCQHALDDSRHKPLILKNQEQSAESSPCRFGEFDVLGSASRDRFGVIRVDSLRFFPKDSLPLFNSPEIKLGEPCRCGCEKAGCMCKDGDCRLDSDCE